MQAHLVGALLASLSLIGAGASGRACAEEARSTRVRVLRIQGAAQQGTLLRLGVDGATLEGAGGGALNVPLADLRDLVVEAPPPATPPMDRLRLTLVGGEQLVAEGWSPAGEGLSVTSASFGTLTVPFDLVQSLVFLPARVGPCHDPLASRATSTGSDHVRLMGGDELHGTVVGATAEGLTLELDRGGSRSVAWSDLLAAVLENPALAGGSDGVVEVETADGSLLIGRGPAEADLAQGLRLALRSLPAASARVPLERVTWVRWRGPQLMDATAGPFTSTYRPLVPPPPGSLAEAFLQQDRGARAGRRPRGCPLRLGGTTYRHGFAVHSGSEVRLPLEGRCSAFEALVGIDDEAVEEARSRDVVPGDVDLRILGDGKLLWEAKGVTGAQPPRRVGPLAVTGVKELVLVVDYGGHDETLDRVTWADPVLKP